jgi:hypothetical protein
MKGDKLDCQFPYKINTPYQSNAQYCSESFETRQGLRQGDVLSTEVIVRRANLQTTGTIYNKETQLLAYADDIGRSQSAVRNAYLALEGEAAKVGLKINEHKKKCMTVALNDRKIRDVGQSVAIGDNHFEVIKEFVYLGSVMTPTNDVSLEIQRRIQTANRYFFGLRKHLRPLFTPDKIHHSQDLDPPSPALRQ